MEVQYLLCTILKKGNEKMKKLFAIIMSVLMIACFMPTMAFADGGGEVSKQEVSKQPVSVKDFDGLKTALEAAADANSGDTTINIEEDITIPEGTQWSSVNINGYQGADIITIHGNGHKITGLNAPLFSGGFAGGSGLVIDKLTLEKVNINDSSNTQGIGAFIGCVDSMAIISLTDCHLIDSSIVSTGGARVGGLIGWTSGYNNQNDGPVDTFINIKNCSVKNTTIQAKGSVGAIIGHAGANPATYHIISGCTVSDTKLESTDDGGWRVGAAVGTANTGQVTIENLKVTGATTLKQGELKPPADDASRNLYGRFVPGAASGVLMIDGTQIEGGTAVVAETGGKYYATLAEAVAAANAGEAVTLLTDIVLDSKLAVNKAITIDGKGHKITANDNFADADNQGHLMLITANAAVKDVTLDSNSKAKGINIYGQDKTLKIAFDKVKMLNSKGNGLTAKGGTVTLKDVEISASAWKQSVDISASAKSKNGADVIIEGNTSLKDELQIIFDEPAEDNVGTITANGWNIAQQDKSFGEGENAYVKRIFTLTKKSNSSGGGSYTPAKSALEKAKEEANAALNAAAAANKYDDAEQAEVKKLLDKAAADIKAAKTEEEVKAIKEGGLTEIDKVLTSEEKAEIEAVTGVSQDIFKAKSKLSKLNGKKAVKVTWNVPGGMKLDGYEVFRSTARYSGFGKTPYFTASKTSYINNKDLVKGKTYYYKVRGFVEINGEKYYTKFSTKAFRIIK